MCTVVTNLDKELTTGAQRTHIVGLHGCYLIIEGSRGGGGDVRVLTEGCLCKVVDETGMNNRMNKVYYKVSS